MPAIAERQGVRVEASAGGANLGAEVTRRAQIRARKAGLLADAGRHFCSIGRPTGQDVTIFKELFYQLVDGSEKGERRALSAILSRNVYTPRTVLIYLALDEPDIAAPVLLFSEALNEIDFAGIILRVSQAHLEILCRRHYLTPATVDRLIAKGGERCREILSRNMALRSDERVQAAIRVSRAVAPLQPAATRSDSTALRPAPAAGAADPARKELLELAGRGGQLGKQATAQAPAQDGARYDPAQPFERQALRVSRQKDPAAFAALVHGFCGAEVVPVMRIIREGGPQSVCVLLKGLGLSDPGALQCLLQLDGSLARSLDGYNGAKSTLARLDARSCRNFLESLGARSPGAAGVALEPSRQPSPRRADAPAAAIPAPATRPRPAARSLLRA